MQIYYYVIFTIFAIITYMMVVDANVVTFIDLLYKIVVMNIRKFYYIVKLHPNNKLETWMMERRIEKMTRELEKEFEDKN